MYTFDLPTTGTISFSDFLQSTDLVSQISTTTQLRSRMRAVLKSNRAGTSSSAAPSSSSNSQDIGSDTSPTASANDWLLIVKTIEEYLPSLLAVFNCVQTDDLLLRYEPVFSWRTSISSPRFRSPQRVDLPGLHYELASVLLTYALTLSNFAAATVASLGSYERNPSLSSTDRKAKDDKLRWAADTLCRASGILLYLSSDLLPKWRDQKGRIDGLPPDLSVEATLALSKVCLAEAQALAIRKLISPSVGKAVDTVTPGPPLEKGHPSASLLAKLHLSVVEEMESATGLLRTVGEKGKVAALGGRMGALGLGEAGLSANHDHELASRRSASNDGADEADGQQNAGKKKLFSKLRSKSSQSSGPAAPSPSSERDLDISSSLLKYLSFSATFHRSMAYKWLGIDAGESANQVGQGIAFLSLSSSLLSSTTIKDLSSALSNISISSTSLLPSTKSSKSAKDRSAVDQELATIQHWLGAYRKLNDTVSFQPVPGAGDVQSKVPAGRAALGLKEYKLPTPSFGPGSEGYVGRGDWKEPQLLDEDHPARRTLAGVEGKGGEGAANHGGVYAGQGAYY